MKYEKLTEEQLEKLLSERYGPDWGPNDLDENDEVVVEYFKRLAEAID